MHSRRPVAIGFHGQLPLAFTDSRNEDRMRRVANTLERSPTELQRMVRAYLPPSWCLVAVGITTNIVDIVQDGFQGGVHKIIGATRPILRVLFGVLFEIFMEYSTQ
jgi:hypothetical protein